jgi:VWFA-related protein
MAAALLPAATPARAAEEDAVLLWPEEQRAFLQDGPGLLLTAEQREALLALDEAGREAFIRDFLARDPLPATPDNELAAAIERRRALAAAEFLSPRDVRARLLFLNGEPAERLLVDCGNAYKPLEIWGYPAGLDERGEPRRRELVVYRFKPGQGYRLWTPIDGKRALYAPEMEYWLEQLEELRGRIRAVRFDKQVCPEAVRVDRATGVDGLFGFLPGRPTGPELERFLAAPEDLAAWAKAALAAAPAKPPPALLAAEGIELFFPDRRGQRLLARMLLVLPPGAAQASTPGVEPAKSEAAGDKKPVPAGARQEESAVPAPAPAAPPASDKPELRLAVQGLLEQEGQAFEEFRVRYRLEPPGEGVPLALAMERALRPGGTFLLRLEVTDEVSGRKARLARGFKVPRAPQEQAQPALPEQVVVALGEDLAELRIAGRDSLVLVPPEEDVVLGLWRAEALVTGARIEKVVFLVDGEVQLTRTRRPFTAEVRLAEFPSEQVVRAEGYDAAGELVASDELVINQPRGALKVTILEPPRGARASGRTRARAEIAVPDGRRLQAVEFRVNDQTVASLTRPPWQADVDVPAGEGIVYLSIVAVLDDGTRAEDTRFLNAPANLDNIDVTLVELYTTVTDRSGQPALGLGVADFEVLEAGKPQAITKFELVEDLPLSVGMVIDTSGSMVSSLVEAQRAAADFLRNVMTPRDHAFALSFADKPVLLMPPTDDVEGVIGTLHGLQAAGYTSLHDALVTSLYYFRGVRGQRALVLLSDGDDTASHTPFREALEYARRSGVAVYTIGLAVSPLSADIRRKLSMLSNETGGRSFFVEKAGQLVGVYEEIEKELRSRYYLAYTPSGAASGAGFRPVEVKVRNGLKARTIRGYYP